MYNLTMSNDLDLAILAAKAAGEVIRKHFKETKIVSKKGFQNFVTETDKEAEKIILSYLEQTGYAVLGEEFGEKTTKSTKKWIIDPIDGTTNFIRGIPFFCISIALLEGDTNLLLGVVYDPIADQCFWAEKQTGAFMNGSKISVNKTSSLDDALLLLEHGRSTTAVEDYLAATTYFLRESKTPVLRQGSTALMLCYVARGSADAFMSSGDALYDYAAGLIIAEEAGAQISDWYANPWESSAKTILASAPAIYSHIISQLALIKK